ncbi:MAG: hypothetical protein AAGA30_19525, partial [Planctomycetota bacterium]
MHRSILLLFGCMFFASLVCVRDATAEDVFRFEALFSVDDIGEANSITPPGDGASLADATVLHLFNSSNHDLLGAQIIAGQFVMELEKGETPNGFNIYVALYFDVDTENFQSRFSMEGCALNASDRRPDLHATVGVDSINFTKLEQESSNHSFIDFYLIDFDLGNNLWELESLTGGIVYAPYDPTNPNRFAGVTRAKSSAASGVWDRALDGSGPTLISLNGQTGCAASLTVGTANSPLLGDVNQDGSVDLLDVSPFVDLLTNGGFQSEADINGDG